MSGFELRWVARMTYESRIAALRMLGVEHWSARRPAHRPGVRAVGQQGPSFVHVLDPLPRALIATEVTRAPDLEAAAQRAFSAEFSPDWQAVVEGEGAPSFTAAQPTPSAVASLKWSRERGDRVRVDVTTSRRGLLVLFESWAPGWSASVDGVPTPVWRTNGMFRGVEVPDGGSTVDFQYAAPGLRGGLVLGGLGALGCLGVAVWQRRSAAAASD